ncbi:MAG: type II secretion system protein GspG [Planctomycetales bacterium]
MKSHRNRRRSRPGFTLLEVLLVLVILGVIAALVVPRLTGAQEEGNILATKTKLAQVEQSLGFYAGFNNGRPPESLDMLLNPIDKDGRPMAPIEKEYPKDAWGNDIQYMLDTNLNGTGVAIRLWSFGPDGVNNQGAPDDINNWDKEGT